MQKQNKLAFTLVELIVVITILAILATIAFISLQGYGSNSRDSKRLSDLGSMKKVLELYSLKNGHYPNPDNVTNITYSGSTAWYLGEFGEQVRRDVERINPSPKDPLTDTYYTYGLTNNRQEYELGTILENANNASLNIITQANANSEGYTAYISGNYNKKILSVRTGNTIKILGVPTLITTDPSVTELNSITETQRRSLFSINKKTNLPGNIIEKINTGILGEGFVVTAEEIYENGAITNTDINNGATSILLYEGTIEDLSNDTIKTKVGENIISYYTGTESTIGNMYQDLASEEGAVVLDALISNRQGGLNSKDVSLSSNTSGGSSSSSSGGETPLLNYFSGAGTISDPYRLDGESITDVTVSANNCNYYNVNATTLNNGSSRGVGTCGVMGSGDKGCLSDGIYMIDNDGVGGSNAIKVYCDMTNDEGGWTMVVRGIKGSNGHRQSINVGILEGPLQTTVYKLADGYINSITQNIYRAQNDQGINEYTTYFQSHDGFKSTSLSLNGSKKTYLGGTWTPFRSNSSHVGFNTETTQYGFSYAHTDNFGEKTGVRIGGIGFSEWRPTGTGNNAVIFSK